MKLVWTVLVVATLAASYAVGHLNRKVEMPTGKTYESFHASILENDTLIRSNNFNGFLASLKTKKAIKRAATIIGENYFWLSKDEVRNFFLAWARINPESAMDWALSQPPKRQSATTSAAMYAWGFHSPRRASKAIQEIELTPDYSSLKGLKERRIEGWIRRGNQRDLITEFLATRPASNLRQRTTSSLIIQLLRDNSQTLISWVENIPEDARDDYKTVVFRSAANILAQINPTRAARLVEDHIEDAYIASSPGLVAKRWVETKDSAAGIEWLMSLPPDRIRSTSVARAIAGWNEFNPEASNIWLRKSTPDKRLDSVVQTKARKSVEMNPKTAIEWAKQIHDPKRQRSIIVDAGKSWLRIDPDSAERWLEEGELAEDLRVEIRETASPQSQTGKPPLPQIGLERIRGNDQATEA